MSGFVSGRDADDFGWPQPPTMSSNKKPTRATKKKAMPVVAAGSKPDVEDNNAEPPAIMKKPAAKKLGDPATTGCSKCYFRGCRACNWRGSFQKRARLTGDKNTDNLAEQGDPKDVD